MQKTENISLYIFYNENGLFFSARMTCEMVEDTVRLHRNVETKLYPLILIFQVKQEMCLRR